MRGKSRPISLCFRFGLFLSTSVSFASTITLAAVGDIILDRGVVQQMEKRGLDYPFEQTRSTLRAADIAFGNLECPISTQPKRSGKPVVFRAAPTTATALSNAGFDMLSLANNHALDCGAAGLKETQSTLRRQNIKFCGVGSTPVIEKNGVRVAFVGFSQFGGEGIAPADDATVRRDITRAKRSADVIVASFHWGVENETRPDARQKALARLAAKCGADLILGHHPHVLQGWELLPAANGRRALAVYSLGNFVFDQRGLGRDETILFRATLDKNGLRSAAATPLKIESCQPQFKLEAATTIAQRLILLSRELGTRLTLISRRGAKNDNFKFWILSVEF